MPALLNLLGKDMNNLRNKILKMDAVKVNDDLTSELKEFNSKISQHLKNMNSEYRDLSAALKRDAYGAIHNAYEYFIALSEKIKILSNQADAKLAEIHRRQNKQ